MERFAEVLFGADRGGPANFQRRSHGVGPDDLLVERVPDQQTGLEVQFGSASFLGSRYELQLTAKGTPLRVQSRTPGTFVDGRARLWFRPESAWVVA